MGDVADVQAAVAEAFRSEWGRVVAYLIGLAVAQAAAVFAVSAVHLGRKTLAPKVALLLIGERAQVWLPPRACPHTWRIGRKRVTWMPIEILFRTSIPAALSRKKRRFGY